MEFDFNVSGACGLSADCPQVACVDDNMLHGPRGRDLCTVFDVMGENSRRAQGLKKAVTFGTPNLYGQKVYLLVHGRCCMGLLKTGVKRLFVTPPAIGQNNSGKAGVQETLTEIEPMCVLDFYVSEAVQRGGWGRKIFDAMLAVEGIHPARLAYDRPSEKLLGFLRKHFNLCKFRPQNNNFVVYDEFFRQPQKPPLANGHGRRGREARESHFAGGPPARSSRTPMSSSLGRDQRLHHAESDTADQNHPLYGSGRLTDHAGGGHAMAPAYGGSSGSRQNSPIGCSGYSGMPGDPMRSYSGMPLTQSGNLSNSQSHAGMQGDQIHPQQQMAHQPLPGEQNHQMMPQQTSVSRPGLISPWGTSADLPPPLPRHGAGHSAVQDFRRNPTAASQRELGHPMNRTPHCPGLPGHSTIRSAPFGTDADEVPAAGRATGVGGSCGRRSSSTPNSMASRRDPLSQGSSARFGSPLSRAGHNLLAQGVW